MIRIRPAAQRGHFNFGWLDTYHTFSFGDYHDPAHMGFRALRVINEDVVQPGQGFGTHGHRDMEIITYVLAGAVEHRDSLGTHGVIRPGEVQRMTAGRGITHSEFNPSPSEPLHLLQIWILPERHGLEPGYEQRAYPDAGRRNRLALVASGDGRDGALTIHQDAALRIATLDSGARIDHPLAAGRSAWVQVARGSVDLAGQLLGPGDGAAVTGERSLRLTAAGPAEILVFDLA